jgi:integrase/recombinase XerC
MLDVAASQINDFLQQLQNKRMSPQTVKSYGRDLARLSAFCDRSDITAWQDLDAQKARGYAASLHHHGLSAKTIQRLLSSARSFYRHLLRTGLAAQNPFAGVSAPRAPKRLPKALSVEQAALLVKVTGDAPIIARDRAIMELFYSSGLRLAELISLNVEDVDLADATVRVTGKGAKTRVLPVGRHAREAITQWLAQRDASADPRPLFTGRAGRRISARSVQARLQYWARRQQLGRPVHPHMLRHSFASHVLESSGDLRAVQELLGHADISTTQIYTHLDFQHLAKVYDQAHPRAKKKQP